MKNENTTQVILLLDNSFTVPQKLHDEVREQVTDIVPALLPDVEYTLQMLCEPEYWDSLTMDERRSAGKCMAHMARKGLIRYVPSGRPCQSPKVYSII